MRSTVDPQKIEQLMKILGKEARGSGHIYFTGGASALLIGFNAIEPEMIRFPSLDPAILRTKVEQFIESCHIQVEENE